MRGVLDTNILVSAFLVQLGRPAAIYRSWREGFFTLLTSAQQLDELRATLHKPAIATRVKPHQAGRLVNELEDFAEIVIAARRMLPPIQPMIFCWPCLNRARPIIW